MKYFSALAVAVALGFGVAACSNAPSSPSSVGGANFNLQLKDSPFTDAKAVFVTFSSVRVHKSDSDWTPLAFANSAANRTCDLKKLETANDVLGAASLPPGHYTQVRLVVQSATVYFNNASSGAACGPTLTAPAGDSAALDIPSGEVKLNREFDVTATSTMNMLIDFDGEQSIHQTGNGKYTMSPVISIVSMN